LPWRWSRAVAFLLGAASVVVAAAQGSDPPPAAAFEGMDLAIREQWPDVQSVVVLKRGQAVYQFHRDGNPESLHEVHSVSKSALATLVGVALQRGQLASLDQPVLALLPEWAGLNPDPRAARITVRHLLTMTAGFEVDDPAGTAPGTSATTAWQRPLRDEPGQRFAYDNSTMPILSAVLEKATGRPLLDYAGEYLVQPMGMAQPVAQGWRLRLRTLDMARLGQLYLQQGEWNGQALLSSHFVRDATRRQNDGGPPANLHYGYLWWVVPGAAPRPTFLASGYAGQLIWVHPASSTVIAATSTTSPGSQARGQVLGLVRTRLFAAAQQAAR